MAIQRVVVEVELGVECDQIAALRNDERVDLDQRSVLFDEEPHQRLEKRIEFRDPIHVETETESDLAHLIGGEPDIGIDGDREDLLRASLGNLFDLHPALGGRDDRQLLCGSIQDHRQVEFRLDLRTRFDVDLADDLALGTRLMRAQGHAEDLTREVLGLIRGFGELDAARLAAPTRVNLCFHDDDVARQTAGGVLCLGGRRRQRARRNGTPYSRNNALAWYS